MREETSEVPQESLEEQKRQQWEDKLRELAVPDHYGYVIEDGIRETVAVLQLLGIDTTQSCEGGENSRTPWIELGKNLPKNIYVGEEELKAKLMAEQGIDLSVMDETSPKFDRAKQVDIEDEAIQELVAQNALYTEEFEKWHKQTLELSEKIKSLIRDFYDTQSTSVDESNLEISLDFPYRSPDHPSHIQDVPFLKVKTKEKMDDNASLSEEEREQALFRNQQEMKRFTDFLKNNFFSQAE